MIMLEDDQLVFSFPDVHEDARCTIEFQRTLRIPDDGKDYPLPPGFGQFPLHHLDDYADGLPTKWRDRGGVIMPMYQAEALWLNFGGGWLREAKYPFAVKVATGRINAVTGETWTNHLNDDPQDYAVIPEQPWLDGYCIENGIIRQFVAAPLGTGHTAEEQITGTGEHGGLQIIVYPMKAQRYQALASKQDLLMRETVYALASPDMGLAPGGRMKQELYDDSYGLDAWDQRHASRCFVSIANSEMWMAITGASPPAEPPTAKQYSKTSLPWFDYYDADAKVLDGSTRLGRLKSLFQFAADGRETSGSSKLPLDPPAVIQAGPNKRSDSERSRAVREVRL